MNILLITTDQQRADTLGVEGSPLGATPRLDAFAAEGTRFAAARTQNPLCQPARATILTGTYPSTHGVTCNGIDLPADTTERSVATLLGRAGYETAMFGKAHFATTFPFQPTGKVESVEGSARVDDDWCGPYFGFDHVELALFGHNLRIADLMGRWNWSYGPPPFGMHYARYLFRDGPERGYERIEQMQPEASGAVWDHRQTWRNALPEEDHLTTWVADRACAWLDAVDGPFFGWVSFTDPHHPMDPPAPWCDRYAPEDVLEVLPTVHPDELDGKPPLHKLLSAGARGRPLEWANPGGATLTREDLAVMTAGYYGMVAQLDHAIGRVLDALAARGLADDTMVIVTTDHGEFLGEHQMIFKGPFGYDSLLRVPLLARGPSIPAGRVVDDPVGTIDLAPTMLANAGLDVPEWIEGRPLLDGTREWVLSENDFSVITWIPMRTLTTARYKLHRYLEHPLGELYDLQEDPGELVNRYDDPAYASVRSDLAALCDDVMNHEARREPIVGLVAQRVAVRIVFETHSFSEDNERGIATGWLPGRLSERGRRAAQELGARRRADGVDALFVSDLWRAVETAQLAFAGCAVPMLLDWRLRECDYGELNGAEGAQVHDRAAYLDTPYPGGESWRDAVHRVGRVLPDLASRWDGRRVLVIGHVATRWGFEHSLLGTPLEQLAREDFAWREGWEYVLPV